MRKNHVLMLLWLFAVAALCFFENNTGTKCILLASILIPTLSVVCTLYCAARTILRPDAPEVCDEGQEITLSLNLSAPKAFVGCSLHTVISVNNRLTGAQLAHPFTAVFSRGRPAPVALTLRYCGLHVFSLKDTFVSDWFDLIRIQIRNGYTAQTVVHPTLYPVELQLSDVGDPIPQGGESLLQNGSGSEMTGLRFYRPGDPLRQIHWKMTEKLDRTVVRESGSLQEMQPLILLELRSSSPKDIHCTVKAFLSSAMALSRNRIAFRAAFLVDGEPVLREICTEEECSRLCRSVPETASQSGEEGIGRIFPQRYPELISCHTALFSSSPDTDAVSLYSGSPVTLILPEQSVLSVAGSELCVRSLSPEFPTLII